MIRKIVVVEQSLIIRKYKIRNIFSRNAHLLKFDVNLLGFVLIKIKRDDNSVFRNRKDETLS